MNEVRDEGRIKPFDATKYLRQMKHLPDVTPLCGILIILVMVFMMPTWGGYWGEKNVSLPEAKYSHYEPYLAPAVIIKNNGNIYFQDGHEDFQNKLNLLPTMIEDKSEELQLKSSKAFFVVEDHVPWGKVRDVMDALKKSRIEVIGLVSDTRATLLDYFYLQKLYRERNLRVPESAE